MHSQHCAKNWCRSRERKTEWFSRLSISVRDLFVISLISKFEKIDTGGEIRLTQSKKNFFFGIGVPTRKSYDLRVNIFVPLRWIESEKAASTSYLRYALSG